MKLSKDERIDLRIELSKVILLFFFLPDFVLPQIPFKGFCKIDTFPIDSGYTRIFSFNYDENEYADLLIFNPLLNKAKLYDGKAGMKFDHKKDITLPFPLSRIEPILLPDNNIGGYAFTSRRERIFGIMKFSTDGSHQVIAKTLFNSFPKNFSMSDLDDDGYPEFLISGNAFDGLELVSYKNNKLQQKVIVSGKNYLNTYFIDLNYDGFKDIVALSSADNCLDFYFNNGRNEFSLIRKVNIDNDVLSMNVFDLNFDYLPDIIVGTSSSINIYYGDDTFSLNNVESIPTSSPVNDFVIGDFNRDGYFDFNILSTDAGKITTIFAKDYFTFNKEFNHTMQKGIVDIIPFFSKFIYGSAFINEHGSVSILSSVKLLSNDQQLAIGIQPAQISTFDLTDNGINDLTFFDNYDNSINFILRNSTGLPDKLFSVDLRETHRQILVFNNSKNIKTFFCFSYHKRLIEFIEIDFDKFQVKRNYLYAEGSIEEILITRSENNNPEIYILYSEGKELNLQVFEKTSLKYEKKIYPNLTSNWSSPVIINANEMLVGYWSREQSSTSYRTVDFNQTKYFYNKLYEFLFSNPSIVSVSNNSVIDKDLKTASLVCGDERVHLIKSGKTFERYLGSDNNFVLRITDKNQLFFDKTNSIFVNDSNSKSFYQIITSDKTKKLYINRLFEDLEIKDFIVTNLDRRHMNLIYIEQNQGYFNIKKLPQ